MGEILDRTFQIYRNRFWACVAISAAPGAILLLLQLGDSYWWHLAEIVRPFRQPQVFIWNLLVSFAYYHLAIVIDAIFAAGLVYLTSEALFGRPASARTSLGFAFARWRSFLWIGVMVLGIVLIGSEAIAIGIFAAMGTSMDALGLLTDGNNAAFAVLFIVPMVVGIGLFLWLTGCLAFLRPACAFQDLRGRKALRRSWILSREARWKTAAVFLLLFMLAWAVGLGVQAAWRWLVILIWQAQPSSHHILNVIYRPSSYAINSLLSIVLHPLYPIAVTLLYYDQRIRKEGFDIEHLMQSAGMTPDAAAIPPQADLPAAPETAPAAAEGWGA